MAKITSGSALFFKLVLVFTIVLMVSTVHSRITVGSAKGHGAVACDEVHGAVDGDTCASVAQQFKLSLQDFSKLNPNLSCDHIFVGQWLCVEAED